MAQGTEYNVINNRMDKLDILTLCDPTSTPIFSTARKYRKVRSDVFEYYADNLDDVSTDTIADGRDVDEFDNKAKNRTVIQQRTQIQNRAWKVSRGQQNDADPAGVKDEVGRAKMLSAIELKRDIEAAIGSDQEAEWVDEKAGNHMRGLGKFLDADNENIPQNARMSAAAKATTSALNEKSFGAVLQAAYEGTGNANAKFKLFAMPALQRAITGFSRTNGESNNILRTTLVAGSKKIECSVKIYESDFGIVVVIPDLFLGMTNGGKLTDAIRGRGYLLDMDKFSISLNQDVWSEEYPDLGGGRRGATWAKYTIINECPKAMGKFV